CLRELGVGRDGRRLERVALKLSQFASMGCGMRNLVIAVLAAAVFSPAAFADDLAFPPNRLAFPPELVSSRDPSVCLPFLAALTRAVESPAFDIDLAGSQWPGATVHWIAPIEDGNPLKVQGYDYPTREQGMIPQQMDVASGVQISALSADLDGDGKLEVVAT